MHAWIRSSLIFAALLSLAAADAVAADAQPGAMLQPFPVGQAATAQPGDAQSGTAQPAATQATQGALQAQQAAPQTTLQATPQGAAMQTGAQPAPAAAPQGAAQPALQVSQPADTYAGAAPAADNGAAADTGSVDDEEAPAPQSPDASQLPPGDQSQAAEAQTSGPKSQTDKIVDHFMELDTDGSKSVSMEEYVAMVQKRMEARFNAMDANHDGQITADEYREFWKSRMAHWYRLNR